MKERIVKEIVAEVHTQIDALHRAITQRCQLDGRAQSALETECRQLKDGLDRIVRTSPLSPLFYLEL